ncbi:MAG: DNA alkylation repair protein [Clostridia bacterium]|nr:DNA alkylation repair protein [Clostridia bacterium]
MKDIIEELFSLQDIKYRDFHSALMPTVPKEKIIGVRIPLVRRLARSLMKDERARDFTRELPHIYYEENNLHAFIICEERDVKRLFDELDRFLPFVDNWATCDSLRPKILSSYKKELIEKIDEWLKSSHEYTVRFAIEMLMVHFLDDDFDISLAERVAKTESDGYYINMMCAWYFATALAKQWDSIFPFIKENRLPLWVHNKAIRKAIESYRITKDQKEILRGLQR